MPQGFAEEFKSFPISPELGESLERARRFAREQSHRLVTLEHLLLALTEDADATAMLASTSIDLPRLSADVSGYLGGLLEDMRGEAQTELRPDGDLMRVLKAATTAAQQSRRRHIDGAIVLAAIVGDAKSAAAGLLKALGMTFEGAIRALQLSSAQARTKPVSAPAGAAWRPGLAAGKSGAVSGEQRPAPGAELAPPPASTEISLATSAEEFLAAARAHSAARRGARQRDPRRGRRASCDPGRDGRGTAKAAQQFARFRPRRSQPFEPRRCDPRRCRRTCGGAG